MTRKPNAGSDRAVKVINRLTHTSGPFAGQSFNLRKWQERDIIRPLFKTKPDGLRQYRTCLLMLPRKNGKSELAAAIAINGLMFDGVIGGQVYSCAADKNQSALVFNVAAQMIRNDKELEAQVEIVDSQKRIVHRKSGSFYRAISAEAYSKHGFSASLVIYDELHAAPDRELWDVMASSQGAHTQPIMMAITTAGYDRTSILWELYEHAKRVQKRPALDPTFLPIIYEAPANADWTSEKVWARCNPALGDFRSLEDMRIMCARAKQIAAQENTFRRLYLNQWTQTHTAAWDMGKWHECGDLVVDDADLVGCPCYGGLDLGQTDDFCAWVRLWELPSGVVVAKARFWLPRIALTRYPHRPYAEWERAGLLEVTDGDTTDLDVIEDAVLADARASGCREVGYDKKFAGQLALHLQGAGVTMIDMPQGFALNESIQSVAKLIVDGRLAHGNNAIATWQMDNTVLKHGRDKAVRIDKDHAKDKIDFAAALTMSNARRIAQLVQGPADDPMLITA